MKLLTNKILVRILINIGISSLLALPYIFYGYVIDWNLFLHIHSIITVPVFLMFGSSYIFAQIQNGNYFLYHFICYSTIVLIIQIILFWMKKRALKIEI
jgi:hypothetical protein